MLFLQSPIRHLHLVLLSRRVPCVINTSVGQAHIPFPPSLLLPLFASLSRLFANWCCPSPLQAGEGRPQAFPEHFPPLPARLQLPSRRRISHMLVDAQRRALLPGPLARACAKLLQVPREEDTGCGGHRRRFLALWPPQEAASAGCSFSVSSRGSLQHPASILGGFETH